MSDIAPSREELAAAADAFAWTLVDELDRESDRLDDYAPPVFYVNWQHGLGKTFATSINKVAPRRGNDEAPNTRPVKEAKCHPAP